jgi:hypoxanthine-DNA glycosylase
MALIHSFMPVGNADAKVLILGSMPGKKSLEQKQYYAHPLNSFWKIMGELAGAHPCLSYAERLDILKSFGIALWDVLAACKRETSQDAHIREESANGFTAFFASHPHITQVYFNGNKAEQCFNRLVRGKQVLPPLQFQRLPSTSPAHAGMRYTDKLQAWRLIMKY